MQLKFLTLNILKGDLLNKVIDFLRKEDPDIVVLQEVYNGTDSFRARKYRSFSVIKQELGIPHGAFAPAFLDVTEGRNVDNGNAIFSKFPIRSSHVVFFDVPYGSYIDSPENYAHCPRNLLRTILNVDSREIDVINTHGIWGLDGKDSKRRLKMSQTIVKNVQDKELVILAGDFNLQPSTRTIGNIEKHLRNVFADELQTTFNMKRKTHPGYAAAVVDMIFVSKSFRTLDHYCPQVDVSDHLPLVCILEV